MSKVKFKSKVIELSEGTFEATLDEIPVIFYPRWLIFAVLLLFLPSGYADSSTSQRHQLCYASLQLNSGIHSFDVIVDPKNIAMGESFVANPEGISTIKSNPATIIGAGRSQFFYSHRDMLKGNVTEGDYYQTAGAAYKVKRSWVGIDYCRFQLEHISVDETASLVYAQQLSSDFVLGISIKVLHAGAEMLGKNRYKVLGDVGILGTVKSSQLNTFTNNKLLFGLSYHNLTTELTNPTTYAQRQKGYDLFPRYARIGFSYRSAIPFKKTLRNIKPKIDYLVTAEAKLFLNPDISNAILFQYSGGLEVVLYDMLALRTGYKYVPFWPVPEPYKRKTFSWGIGIKSKPVHIKGEDIMIDFKIEYSNIPVILYSFIERDVNLSSFGLKMKLGSM